MDLLTAILACSLYRDDALVRAIAESNSQGNPYAVIDASLPPDGPTPMNVPHSLAAAVSTMQAVQIEGGEPLLGLMQVPAEWAISFRRRPEDLFDPCTNIEVATAKLSELEYDCSHPLVRVSSTKPPQRRLKRLEPAALQRCVVEHYAAGIHMPEFATVVLLELEHQLPTAGVPASIYGAGLVPGQAAATTLGANDRRIFLQPLGAIEPPPTAPTSTPRNSTAVQARGASASPVGAQEPAKSTLTGGRLLP